MLGLGSPHGDSHCFLFSAPLWNNLAVTFLLSLSFPLLFFFLVVSKEENFSTPRVGGAELG